MSGKKNNGEFVLVLQGVVGRESEQLVSVDLWFKPWMADEKAGPESGGSQVPERTRILVENIVRDEGKRNPVPEHITEIWHDSSIGSGIALMLVDGIIPDAEDKLRLVNKSDVPEVKALVWARNPLEEHVILPLTEEELALK